MTYTHLTTNELIMIEVYYKESLKVTDIIKALGGSKQTVYNVINFLKDGLSAYDYYEHYKANKKRCGRRKTSVSQRFTWKSWYLSWFSYIVRTPRRRYHCWRETQKCGYYLSRTLLKSHYHTENQWTKSKWYWDFYQSMVVSSVQPSL